jgi:acyl carrier protein
VERIDVVQAFTEALDRRGVVYAENLKLVEDAGMDSYDLVSVILEMEEVMDVAIDDDTQMLFSEASLSNICDRLSSLK